MKQRPIIFNTEMVQAIVDGRKTQTRRIVKPLKDKNFGCNLSPNEVAGEVNNGDLQNCPFGYVGDQLYVRETFADWGSRLTYKADKDDGAHCVVKRWTPSIHMPRACARIILEVTNVRVERLIDICESDAKAEGINCVTFRDECLGLCEGFTRQKDDGKCQLARTAKSAFLDLWDSIYSNSNDNPFVWVIEFKVISTTGGEA